MYEDDELLGHLVIGPWYRVLSHGTLILGQNLSYMSHPEIQIQTRFFINLACAQLQSIFSL